MQASLVDFLEPLAHQDILQNVGFDMLGFSRQAACHGREALEASFAGKLWYKFS